VTHSPIVRAPRPR